MVGVRGGGKRKKAMRDDVCVLQVRKTLLGRDNAIAWGSVPSQRAIWRAGSPPGGFFSLPWNKAGTDPTGSGAAEPR